MYSCFIYNEYIKSHVYTQNTKRFIGLSNFNVLLCKVVYLISIPLDFHSEYVKYITNLRFLRFYPIFKQTPLRSKIVFDRFHPNKSRLFTLLEDIAQVVK